MDFYCVGKNNLMYLLLYLYIIFIIMCYHIYYYIIFIFIYQFILCLLSQNIIYVPQKKKGIEVLNDIRVSK